MKTVLQIFTTKLAVFTMAVMVSGASLFAQGVVTVGDVDGSNTTTSYPAPMGDYYKQDRQQYLFLASELAAAGLAAGDITALGWNVIADYVVTDADMGVMESYTIKMMSTASTSLDTWESGAFVVWGPADYIPVGSALNEFTLDAPFNWDGVSNVIVEVCGGVSSGEWDENAQVEYDDVGFNASYTYRSDSYSDVLGAICDYDGTSSSGTNPTRRPVTNFTGELADGCAGTPDAGTASSSAESVCADEEFTVSVSAGETGTSYQWQSSSDDVTYTDIDGATSIDLATTQGAATYYRCVVTCDATGDSDNSGSVFVDQLAGADCLCIPVFTNIGSGDYINDFEMAGISNLGSGEAASNYIDYTGTYSTDLIRGANYPTFIDIGPTWDQTVKIYIDLNQDGVLAEDEAVGCKWVDNATGGRNLIVSIPEDAALGTTTMRVMCDYGNFEECDVITSCYTAAYGEAEDYPVTIVDGDVCPTPTGLGVDLVSETEGTIFWDAMAGAEDYTVTIKNLSTLAVGKANVAGTSLLSDNFTAGTTYSVRVRTNCGDEVSDFSSYFSFTTSVRLGQFDDKVSIYPNPSDGLFRIQLNDYTEGDVQIMVNNQLGQSVYSNIVSINDAVTVHEMDLTNLPSGTYLISIVNGDKLVTDRIVIE